MVQRGGGETTFVVLSILCYFYLQVNLKSYFLLFSTNYYELFVQLSGGISDDLLFSCPSNCAALNSMNDITSS